ncbi:MAG: GntR family transcriptional regulator [Marinibacterium sp.]|nr:GntR family transcriptional regulator [Marinibacterium sp.]
MRTGYQDIKADILDKIRQNLWPPGAYLPGEIELAQSYGCARATVNRAMRDLVDDGVLERKRKAGTRVKAVASQNARFAIPLVREEIEATGATYRYALVERQTRAAPGWLRARVQLDADTQVLELRCMHFADNQPFQLEDRWINLDTIPDARHQSFEAISPNEWLVREVPFSKADLSFAAINATPEMSDFLGAAPQDAVFMAERSTWMDHRNVTHARLYFHRGYRMMAQF